MQYRKRKVIAEFFYELEKIKTHYRQQTFIAELFYGGGKIMFCGGGK